MGSGQSPDHPRGSWAQTSYSRTRQRASWSLLSLSLPLAFGWLPRRTGQLCPTNPQMLLPPSLGPTPSPLQAVPWPVLGWYHPSPAAPLPACHPGPSIRANSGLTSHSLCPSLTTLCPGKVTAGSPTVPSQTMEGLGTPSCPSPLTAHHHLLGLSFGKLWICPSRSGPEMALPSQGTNLSSAWPQPISPQ